MIRDVVKTSFTLNNEIQAKLRNRFEPNLIAIPHIRINLDFEEEDHFMDFDFDYDFATEIVHVSCNIFSCDICGSKDENGEIYADISNKRWCVNGAEKWFYETVKDQQGMMNWQGIYSMFILIQNYIAKYGLIESFDVEEKVAKKSVNTHRTGKRKKNEVRLYRCYTLKKDWKTTKRLKTIYTCEQWNVRGHYRHYKSGKVGYVKPYTKGKKRNEQASSTGKEYKLQIGGKSKSD